MSTKLSKHFEFTMPLSNQARINHRLHIVHNGDLEISGVAYKHDRYRVLDEDPDTDFDVDQIFWKANGWTASVDITGLRGHFDDLNDKILVAARQHVDGLDWSKEEAANTHPLSHHTIGTL